MAEKDELTDEIGKSGAFISEKQHRAGKKGPTVNACTTYSGSA
jgi:hypothetical protein